MRAQCVRSLGQLDARKIAFQFQFVGGHRGNFLRIPAIVLHITYAK
ncbi:hypothetical protein NCV_01635 [Burkholderia pseudomallei]